MSFALLVLEHIVDFLVDWAGNAGGHLVPCSTLARKPSARTISAASSQEVAPSSYTVSERSPQLPVLISMHAKPALIPLPAVVTVAPKKTRVKLSKVPILITIHRKPIRESLPAVETTASSASSFMGCNSISAPYFSEKPFPPLAQQPTKSILASRSHFGVTSSSSTGRKKRKAVWFAPPSFHAPPFPSP